MNDESIDQLEFHRRKILEHVQYISDILKISYPKEYDTAYSHWIPQIVTALVEHNQWLQRGAYNMQNTIDHIKDNNSGSGVYKFIK